MTEETWSDRFGATLSEIGTYLLVRARAEAEGIRSAGGDFKPSETVAGRLLVRLDALIEEKTETK